MAFIEYLKYGAIGISLALAVLSYRLLSKEQDKGEERPAMLKSIRNYFILAIVLSVFFGSTEIVTKVFYHKNTEAESAILELWDTHLSDHKDETLHQKIRRVVTNFQVPSSKPSTNSKELAELEVLLAECKKEMETSNTGFYQSITNLRETLNEDQDGWTNIDYRPQTKTHYIAILRRIFDFLNEYDESSTDADIRHQWKALKSKWTTKNTSFIFQSDIPAIVRYYLDKFYPETH